MLGRAAFGQRDGVADHPLRQLGLGLFNEDLTGKVDAELNLAGKGARLDGTLAARLEDARAD